jgi:DNA-binding XRE family transcriptional regulator
MFTQSPYNALVRARFAAGLSQAELAAAVSTTPRTIWAIERRKRIPSVTLALAIARVLDRDVESLFGDER